MKNYIIILLCFFSTLTFAQKPNHHNGDKGKKKEERAKIEQIRKQYINTKLALNTKDSLLFWPIYDDFTVNYRKLKRNIKLKKRSISTNKNLTDVEAKKTLTEIDLLEQRLSNLKKSSNEKFAAIIGYAKTAQLPELEREFKKTLLRELKARKSR